MSFLGKWDIIKMGMWDEDYFNMEVQAYIEIEPNNLGSFQFGLVSAQIDGKIIDYAGQERFEFNTFYQKILEMFISKQFSSL